MVSISVKVDIKAATKNLTKIQKKQIPFAASQAINATAFGLREELNKSTDKQIDRPTAFTKRAMRVTKSTKRTQKAEVFVAPTQYKYLQKIIFGSSGQRRVVPVSARTNAFGNLSRNYVNSRKNKPKYFSGRPNNKKGMKPGLYQVMGGKRNRRLKMHTANERNTRHRKSWSYFQVANRYVARNFSRNMDKALANALATAR